MAENEEMKPYETDALSAYKQMPLAVILPENTQEVSFWIYQYFDLLPGCAWIMGKINSSIYILLHHFDIKIVHKRKKKKIKRIKLLLFYFMNSTQRKYVHCVWL